MKEGNVLFNDTLNTFYLRLAGDERKVDEDHRQDQQTSDRTDEQSSRLIEKKEMFYLTTHSTHFMLRLLLRQTYGKGPLE